MSSWLDILQINEIIVYFLYGLVFFALGLVVALRSGGSRKHSRLALAGYLGWLASFGISHGFNEWGNVFIPIQATYLSQSQVTVLRIAQTGLLALSYCLLAQFGALVALPPSPWRRALRLAPVVPVVGLAALLVFGGTLDATDPDHLKAWIRRLIAFPSAALAAYGMYRQASLVERLGLGRIAQDFRLAAISLGAYAVFAGIAVPAPDHLAAQWPNYELVLDLFGVPIVVLRSLAGVGVVLGINWGLKVFEVETNRRLEEAERRRLREEVRGLLFRQTTAAQEEERRRVARELHDETGQGLSAVIMGLGAAGEMLDRDPIRARKVLEESRELAVTTLQGVRQIILGLRPASLDDLGLLPALRRLADDAARRAHVEIEVDGGGLTQRLPPVVETALFRIVQEGLNNLGQHAAARHVRLRLWLVGSEVHVLLEDDGVGFDPARALAFPSSGRGMGLLGMQERASLLGGEVAIESEPGRGTRVSVRLPIEAPDGARDRARVEEAVGGYGRGAASLIPGELSPGELSPGELRRWSDT